MFQIWRKYRVREGYVNLADALQLVEQRGRGDTNSDEYSIEVAGGEGGELFEVWRNHPIGRISPDFVQLTGQVAISREVDPISHSEYSIRVV